VEKDKNKKLRHFRGLDVYQSSFQSAMEIFQITKGFPVEEWYALTDQMRRSSRSVCSNLAEAWRKRRYKAFFKNKLTDSMSEASETQTWLEFCCSCKYIDKKMFEKLDSDYEHIIGMLNSMEKKAETFCF
jgi:four helix bundle protein